MSLEREGEIRESGVGRERDGSWGRGGRARNGGNKGRSTFHGVR
jgi:hypothetical protein